MRRPKQAAVDKQKLVKSTTLAPLTAVPLLRWVHCCYLGKVPVGTVGRSLLRGEYIWRARLPGVGPTFPDGGIGANVPTEAEGMKALEDQIRAVLERLFPPS